jgi:hypothetical protein
MAQSIGRQNTNPVQTSFSRRLTFVMRSVFSMDTPYPAVKSQGEHTGRKIRQQEAKSINK